MRTTFRASMIAVVLVAVVTGLSISAGRLSAGGATALAQPIDRRAFHDEMRKLWEDHITWTRLVIVSKLTLPADLPDLAVTVDRLLQNQVDIGDAIEPFYEAPAADALTKLLTEHILFAADILAAAKAGDAAALTIAIDAWYDNAHDVAVFLNAANPRFWPLDEMDQMMREHLDLTFAEAVARLEGRYADDVAAYDEVHLQILAMADMLSNGIIGQFPQRFSGAR
jgi:hypothetical protein